MVTLRVLDVAWDAFIGGVAGAVVTIWTSTAPM
jgi:hypothetical protein